MSFALAPEIEDLAAAAGRLAARSLAPGARRAEAEGRWPPEVVEVIHSLALGGLDLPVVLGGVAAGALAKVEVLEALAAGDAGGLPALDQPGPAVGAVLACPDTAAAGEVAAAGLAGVASCALVVADPGFSSRIEWAPGWPVLRWAWVIAGDDLALVEVAPAGPAPALAFHASGSTAASLGGAPVLGRWRLPDGAGVSVRGRARLWAAAVSLGVGRAALEATIAYTTERVVFAKPVAHHQGNAFDLAVAATGLHGAGLLLRDAAARVDGGDRDGGFWATQAWLETIDAVSRVTDLGIQLLGGHGFLVDHLAEKRFREARMLGLLWGGRDAADADVAAGSMSVEGPLFAETAQP